MKEYVVAVVGEDCKGIYSLLFDRGVRVVNIPHEDSEDISDLMPDLVLLPVLEDTKAAQSVCKSLKRDSKTRPIPVVFITTLETKVDEALASISGCIDYITNFNNKEGVLAKLITYIKLGKLEKSVSRIRMKLEAA